MNPEDFSKETLVAQEKKLTTEIKRLEEKRFIEGRMAAARLLFYLEDYFCQKLGTMPTLDRNRIPTATQFEELKHGILLLRAQFTALSLLEVEKANNALLDHPMTETKNKEGLAIHGNEKEIISNSTFISPLLASSVPPDEEIIMKKEGMAKEKQILPPELHGDDRFVYIV